MLSRLINARLVLASGTLLGLGGGCFTSAQLQDFVRTQYASTVSGFFGQLFSLFLQSRLPQTAASILF